MDRTPTIRASLNEVEHALALATVLVVTVVFLFLRNGRAALIPSVAVPVSLLGTFAVMQVAGFSLNTISLMALTVATSSWWTTRWWCWKTWRAISTPVTVRATRR